MQSSSTQQDDTCMSDVVQNCVAAANTVDESGVDRSRNLATHAISASVFCGTCQLDYTAVHKGVYGISKLANVMQLHQTLGQEDRRLCSHSVLQPIVDQRVQSHSCTAGCIEPTRGVGSQSGPPPQQTPGSGPSADATLCDSGTTTALDCQPASSHDQGHDHLISPPDCIPAS